MKFTLEIELGNDAMQTYPDIDRALMSLSARFASRLHVRKADGSPSDGDGGLILDHNGNSVGKWEVSE